MRLLLRRFPALGGLQLVALLCAAVIGIASANAATLIVTTTADSGAGSLRQALADASDGDTIQFESGLNGQTIGLTSGELAIKAFARSWKCLRVMLLYCRSLSISNSCLTR